MVESFAIARLQREFRELSQNEDTGFSVGLVDDNWFVWTACFPGPSETPWEGGMYMANLRFPNDYPNSPPEMIFKCELWHPNIFRDGRVCISILHPAGEDVFNALESSAERWRPILGVESILVSVISMLNDPNLDSPANMDAAIQFRDDRQNY